MSLNVFVPWYAQARSSRSELVSPRFVDFDEVFDFMSSYFGENYDIRFTLVSGNCPMSTCVFSDTQPFISIDADMRFPVQYSKAVYTIAIPTHYGGYASGKYVRPKGYHTEFYLIPRV